MLSKEELIASINNMNDTELKKVSDLVKVLSTENNHIYATDEQIDDAFEFLSEKYNDTLERLSR